MVKTENEYFCFEKNKEYYTRIRDTFIDTNSERKVIECTTLEKWGETSSFLIALGHNCRKLMKKGKGECWDE